MNAKWLGAVLTLSVIGGCAAFDRAEAAKIEVSFFANDLNNGVETSAITYSPLTETGLIVFSYSILITPPVLLL